MELDPHVLQVILEKIKQQMRCPQCGRDVPVDFSNVQVVADEMMLLQLKCEECDAYIVLQASLQGIDHIGAAPYQEDPLTNVSSQLQSHQPDVHLLRDSLEKSGGSFTQLFGLSQSDVPSKPTAD